MPYRVVEYVPSQRNSGGRRPVSSRSPRTTVYYAGRSGYGGFIPRTANMRLVSVPPPPRFSRSQDIYSLGDEAYRLPYKTKVVHIEDLSNYGNHYDDMESCSDIQVYDSEAEIRRDASDVLLRLAYGLPVPLYSVKNIPLRSSSELRDIVDVRRKFVRERNNLSSMSRIQSEIYRMAMYQEPLRKPFLGKGNLACLSFAGGKPISKRQLRYVPEDNGIRDAINFRSFYNNLRVAETLGTFYKKPVTYQPLYKSKKSLLGLKDDSEEKPKRATESKWVTRASVGESKPKAEKAIQKPEIQRSFVLPAPRKSIIEVPEEVKSLKPEEPEPEVVVKISRKSIQEDYPFVPETRETIKLSSSQVEQEEEAPAPEPEVFVDTQEPEPLSPEPVEEIFEEAHQDMLESTEQEPDAYVQEESKPELEDEIQESPVEAENVEVEEAAPEIPEAASPSPRAASRNEEIASPISDVSANRGDEGQGPMTNGQDDPISGDEKEIEDPQSPLPTKDVCDDEPEEPVQSDEGIAENNNYDEEPIAPEPDKFNGSAADVGEESHEPEEVKDDPWWNTQEDDNYKRVKYDNHEEEEDHEDQEDAQEPVQMSTKYEEAKDDNDKEEKVSECEDSE